MDFKDFNSSSPALRAAIVNKIWIFLKSLVVLYTGGVEAVHSVGNHLLGRRKVEIMKAT